MKFPCKKCENSYSYKMSRISFGRRRKKQNVFRISHESVAILRGKNNTKNYLRSLKKLTEIRSPRSRFSETACAVTVVYADAFKK